MNNEYQPGFVDGIGGGDGLGGWSKRGRRDLAAAKEAGVMLDLDCPGIGRIIKGQNFRGWVSLEFEGNKDYKTAIPKSLAVLRVAFA